MSRTLAFAALLGLASLTTATGCGIYGGDDDCNYGGAAEPDRLATGLRNPATGQCEYQGGGGGTCNQGDYGGYAEEAPQAPVDWAMCWSACTGLDQDTCKVTPGCRAVEIGDCLEGWDCDSETFTYFECWATAPSGPVQGPCEGLDAQECSRHDDCIARHYPSQGGCTGGTGAGDCAPQPDQGTPGNFHSCVSEAVSGCYSDADCGSGTHCNADEVCLPDPQGCGGTGTGGSGFGVPCEVACYGYCVPDNTGAGSCYGDVLCDVVEPQCPINTVPGKADGCYTGYCIPWDQCSPPIDRGLCYAPVACLAMPPECPSGSVPGVKDGCWSGFCIEMSACEAQAACSEIANEPACVARTDCKAIYEGVNCSCDPAGNCTCQDWVFDACEAQ
jgi:hypothetical protein